MSHAQNQIGESLPACCLLINVLFRFVASCFRVQFLEVPFLLRELKPETNPPPPRMSNKKERSLADSNKCGKLTQTKKLNKNIFQVILCENRKENNQPLKWQSWVRSKPFSCDIVPLNDVSNYFMLRQIVRVSNPIRENTEIEYHVSCE